MPNAALISTARRTAKKSRTLALLPREEYELLAASRIEQRTPEWKQMYNKRAGIEGSFSQGVRSFGLRRSRYRGPQKTHLQNIAIACAINLQRLTDYWSGVPPTTTRTSTLPDSDNGSCDGIRQQCPYSVKDSTIGLRTINAKAETITTAPASREAFSTD
ncbi:MAG: transposase [Candidatus Sulfotelmatobacter sp.]